MEDRQQPQGRREMVVEVHFDNPDEPIVREYHSGCEQEVFVSEIFALVSWAHHDGMQTAFYHYTKSCSPTIVGQLHRLTFRRSFCDEIRVALVEGELPTDAIQRVSLFVHSDCGVFLVSLYPHVRRFARQLVVVASHKPKQVAWAQHIMASWALEVYARHDS